MRGSTNQKLTDKQKQAKDKQGTNNLTHMKFHKYKGKKRLEFLINAVRGASSARVSYAANNVTSLKLFDLGNHGCYD